MDLRLRSKPTKKLTQAEYEKLKGLTVPGRLMRPSLEVHKKVLGSRAVMAVDYQKTIHAWCYIFPCTDGKWYIHVFVPKHLSRKGLATRLVKHALKFCPAIPIAQEGDDGTDIFWSKFNVEFIPYAQ